MDYLDQQRKHRVPILLRRSNFNPSKKSQAGVFNLIFQLPRQCPFLRVRGSPICNGLCNSLFFSPFLPGDFPSAFKCQSTKSLLGLGHLMLLPAGEKHQYPYHSLSICDTSKYSVPWHGALWLIQSTPVFCSPDTVWWGKGN